MVAARQYLAPASLGKALPLSLLVWLFQGLSLVLIVHNLGFELGTATIIGIYCLSLLARALSLIPGGLSATEASITLMLINAGGSRLGSSRLYHQPAANTLACFEYWPDIPLAPL